MQDFFESHEIALFRRVIDIVCAELGECDESTETYIAHRILCRAQRGNWDYATLLCAARVDAKPSSATRQMKTVH